MDVPTVRENMDYWFGKKDEPEKYKPTLHWEARNKRHMVGHVNNQGALLFAKRIDDDGGPPLWVWRVMQAGHCYSGAEHDHLAAIKAAEEAWSNIVASTENYRMNIFSRKAE